MGFPATPALALPHMFLPSLQSLQPVQGCPDRLGVWVLGLPCPGSPFPTLNPTLPPVVFRYALAIFKYNEEALLRLQDSLEIYQYLHFFTKTICDSR